MTEFRDTQQAYDYVLYSTMPTVVEGGQTIHCSLKEGPVGVIINADTQHPFTLNDACVSRNRHQTHAASRRS
jgi:hypothetical protein